MASSLESLVLAQSVYEHGADAWQPISRVLTDHPALGDRPFSPDSCRQTYLRLMNEAALECSDDANNKPHAPLHLALAQRHYSARLVHLRDLIAAEEVKFKRIVAEINEIRSGAWDDKIRANLAAVDVQSPADPPPECPDTLSVQVADAVIKDVEQPQVPPIDATTTLVTEDAVPEPPPADGIEVPATVEISETSKPEMDVELPAAIPDPDEKAKPQPREGKRKIGDSENIEESVREKKRPRDESAPTDADEQTSRQRSSANELASHHQTPPSVPNKRFQAVIGMLHSQISQHRNGNIFHNPIKNSEAPDYHDIIKRPMDLKTIKARVKDGVISNSLEFQRDVYVMFANAMMYNRPTSDIYHMAEEMMAESEEHINTFRQTEGFIRSTRA